MKSDWPTSMLYVKKFFQAPDGGFRQVDLHRRTGWLPYWTCCVSGAGSYASDSRLPRFRALALTYLLDQGGAADLLILDAPVKNDSASAKARFSDF